MKSTAYVARQWLYAERLWSAEEIANMSDEDAVLFAEQIEGWEGGIVKTQPITSKTRVAMSVFSPVLPAVYDPRWPSDHHPWRSVHLWIRPEHGLPGEYMRWSSREVVEGERWCSNGLHVAADWPPCCKVELPA